MSFCFLLLCFSGGSGYRGSVFNLVYKSTFHASSSRNHRDPVLHSLDFPSRIRHLPTPANPPPRLPSLFFGTYKNSQVNPTPRQCLHVNLPLSCPWKSEAEVPGGGSHLTLRIRQASHDCCCFGFLVGGGGLGGSIGRRVGAGIYVLMLHGVRRCGSWSTMHLDGCLIELIDLSSPRAVHECKYASDPPEPSPVVPPPHVRFASDIGSEISLERSGSITLSAVGEVHGTPHHHHESEWGASFSFITSTVL